VGIGVPELSDLLHEVQILEYHQVLPFLASAEVLEVSPVHLKLAPVRSAVFESEDWVAEVVVLCVVLDEVVGGVCSIAYRSADVVADTLVVSPSEVETACRDIDILKGIISLS